VRILQVSPFFSPHAGGVESHVRSLSGEMVRQGHEVTVLTSRFDRSLPVREELDGFTVIRSATPAVWFNTPIDRGTRRAIRGIPTDVVHLHYPPPLSSYFAVRGLSRTLPPVCMTYHCDLYLPGISGRLLTTLYEQVFLRTTLRRVNRVIVHTRSYGNTSSPLRGRRLEIIPSSVDTTRFRPDVSGEAVRRSLGLEGRRVIVFTGRLVFHKGVDALLRALVELPPDVALLIIGRGPRLGELRTVADRLGIGRRVAFCPNVSDEELPTYLRAGDLFAFPSQNRLEGFGLAVAEAMASGLPVVIADMPGVREVIDPGVEGLLVEPMIPQDLARRIGELLDDPPRLRRMGEAGRKRAEERFALPLIARAVLRLYADLLATG
jgi:glycosyltransferase involved in cell wall biosynthesis